MKACSEVPLNTFSRKYKPSMNRVALGLVHTTRAALDAAKSAGSNQRAELNSCKREVSQLKQQLKGQQKRDRRTPAPPRETDKACPECWRDLGLTRYHYPCDPVKREAAMKKTKKASTTHMVTRIRCDTRGMPAGTQLCPHCSLDEERKWTQCNHLQKYGPEQCFSRPNGPLQGLTGPAREAKRKQLLDEHFARSPRRPRQGKGRTKGRGKGRSGRNRGRARGKGRKGKSRKGKGRGQGQLNVLFTQTGLVASDEHNMDDGRDIDMVDPEPEPLLSDPDPYEGEGDTEHAEPVPRTEPRTRGAPALRTRGARAPEPIEEDLEEATLAFEAQMKKQVLARDKRAAGHRAREQADRPAQDSRAHNPSASLNGRRKDGPRGDGETATRRKYALAAKARREARQARDAKARADRAEQQLLGKARNVEVFMEKRTARQARKAQRESALTSEQRQHLTAGQYSRDRVARAESLGQADAYDKCVNGYKGTIPTISPELMAEAKLGLEVAARNNAICRRKGFNEESLAQSDKTLDEAFTRYQNLVTQNCLKEMAPRLEKPEHYVMRQVAHAMKLAEQAKGPMVLPTG